MVQWTPVSRRLNILCIKFKIIAFFIITLFNRLYARACILLTYGKHFHDRIISLILEVWVHKTGLTPPLFIEVPVPSQESELSGSCVLGVSIFYDFNIRFKNCSDCVVFFVFHLIDWLIDSYKLTTSQMIADIGLWNLVPIYRGVLHDTNFSNILSDLDLSCFVTERNLNIAARNLGMLCKSSWFLCFAYGTNI